MDETKAPKLDWVHLPPGVEAGPSWESFRNGILRSLRTDLLQRTARLDFSVDTLRALGGLPKGVTFVFLFEEVTSVRATAMEMWPGPRPDARTMSPADAARAGDAFRAKWREESLAWTDVERCIAADGAVVSAVTCVLGQGEVAFQLLCCLRDDRWPSLFLHARRLRVERSDGVPFSLDEFLSLVAAYRDAFATGEVH